MSDENLFANVSLVDTPAGFAILLEYTDGEAYLSQELYKTREEAEAAAYAWVGENLREQNICQ